MNRFLKEILMVIVFAVLFGVMSKMIGFEATVLAGITIIYVKLLRIKDED